jgi:hypothetical protein
MGFPVQSTSVETRAAKRAMRVMQRTKVAKLISYAGCYNCRSIAGSSTPSQHSYGNADDLFPKPGNDDLERKDIFHAVIWQATHRTKENRLRPLPIAHVIDHDARLIWTPSEGIHAYTGDTGDHVHLDYLPQYSGACGARP